MNYQIVIAIAGLLLFPTWVCAQSAPEPGDKLIINGHEIQKFLVLQDKQWCVTIGELIRALGGSVRGEGLRPSTVFVTLPFAPPTAEEASRQKEQTAKIDAEIEEALAMLRGLRAAIRANIRASEFAARVADAKAKLETLELDAKRFKADNHREMCISSISVAFIDFSLINVALGRAPVGDLMKAADKGPDTAQENCFPTK